MLNIEFARTQMIAQQVRAWDVLDQRVLAALQSVRREEYVPEAYRELAFADTAVPLGHGQAMLPPKVDGRILQALDLRPTDEVLEVGTGSGYLTACLAALAGRIRSLEIYPDLAAQATRNLRAAGVTTASVETLDALRVEEVGRYDAVLVSGSLPIHDARFERALKAGGRLFVVVGSPPVMEALLIRRDAGAVASRMALFETVIAPLVNAPQPPRFVF
jgi:protein-L-isoaspartate(D-aspartate) O-methyltransferase